MDLIYLAAVALLTGLAIALAGACRRLGGLR